jgi:hypothetical protein
VAASAAGPGPYPDAVERGRVVDPPALPASLGPLDAVAVLQRDLRLLGQRLFELGGSGLAECFASTMG